jgi:ABC-type uncharacterized transport system fused permease/ATPase subunit
VPAARAGSAADSARGEFAACDGAIEFDGATVVTPADVTLVRELTLRVPFGTNLLVTGPNGAGKSSLFRCAVRAPGRLLRGP